MIARAAAAAAALVAALAAGYAREPASAAPVPVPAPVATHAVVPAPRATFVVTVKSRRSGRTKVSSWTTVPIRPNGTLQTSRNAPAQAESTAAAALASPASNVR